MLATGRRPLPTTRKLFRCWQRIRVFQGYAPKVRSIVLYNALTSKSFLGSAKAALRRPTQMVSQDKGGGCGGYGGAASKPGAYRQSTRVGRPITGWLPANQDNSQLPLASLPATSLCSLAPASPANPLPPKPLSEMPLIGAKLEPILSTHGRPLS